jgi:hypothetical protein
MLVRWCLATPDRARRFREFLRAVSRGGAADLDALAEALETEGRTLSQEFLEWVRAGAPAR